MSTSSLIKVGEKNIADGAVSESKIAADAVTTGKVKDAEIKAQDLAVDAVETSAIKDLNVTHDKIALSAIKGENINGTQINDGVYQVPANAVYNPGKMLCNMTQSTPQVIFIEFYSSEFWLMGQQVSGTHFFDGSYSRVKNMSPDTAYYLHWLEF